MDLLRRWRRVPPGAVYALYEGGERVGPLPVIYSHYRRGLHYWEVLVPYHRAEQMRGISVEDLPARTALEGTLSEAVDPHQWHADEGTTDRD